MPGISSAVQTELNVLKSAKSTNGQVFFTGSAAVSRGQETENVQTDGSNALQKGDVITMPATEQEFDECFFALQMQRRANATSDPRPACGVVVEVTRGSKKLAVRLFASTLARRVVEWDKVTKTAKGTLAEDDACQWGNKGKDLAEDKDACKMVREYRGFVYDALKQLVGKTLNVTDKRPITTNVFNRAGEREDAQGNPIIGTQNVVDVEIA